MLSQDWERAGYRRLVYGALALDPWFQHWAVAIFNVKDEGHWGDGTMIDSVFPFIGRLRQIPFICSC